MSILQWFYKEMGSQDHSDSRCFNFENQSCGFGDQRGAVNSFPVGNIIEIPIRVNCTCLEQCKNPNSQGNICSNFTNKTWMSWPNHSQGSCEWVNGDLEVLLVELKQILHLKVGCSDFGPVWDRDSLPYLPTPVRCSLKVLGKSCKIGIPEWDTKMLKMFS